MSGMAEHVVPPNLLASAAADERLREPGWHAFTRSRLGGHLVEAWVGCTDRADAVATATMAKLGDPRHHAWAMLTDADGGYADSFLILEGLSLPPDAAEISDGL